ncbi:unnamed protein product [Calicophoron daubneyi]|uniref:Fasciculation and elongation protein zeta-2 n=1 Tax=Calicophoron daubneyi TaxID=300641 RepID=A0AAV2TY57_CALDB
MEGGTVVLNNSREDSRPLSPLDLVASFEYQLEKCFGCSRELDFQESEATESGPIIHAEAYVICARLLVLHYRQWPWSLNVLNNQPYIDWHSSKLFQTYIGSLDLAPPENQESLNLDLPDDEELAFAFDHHSLVTSQLPDSYDEDPVKTADEVIREIDLIMGHSDDVVFSPFSDEAAITEFDLPAPTVNVGSAVVPEKDLGNLSLCQLNALLEDLESCVREYSAVLVQELAYREELDFEQEQKDIFIARLDEMHRRLERRRRRSSMPPVNRSRHLDSGTIAIPDDLDSPGAVDGEAEFSMDHIEKKPTEQKQSRPVLQRAQSAAQAAKTILQRQWHRLSRGPDEMSGADKEPEFDGKSYPSNEPFFREHGMDVGSICPPPTSTIPMHTSRAMTIARLRKWASKKASEALNSKTTGSFRALLRRANKRAETARSGMREARSAVTSPMSSQTDMPILPATLTHSASGHLVGNHGINADDLEYKNLTTTIPYHRSPTLCGPTVEQLELFNEMLLAILTNNPNLTPMLTDYILNVYAPADHTLSRLPI